MNELLQKNMNVLKEYWNSRTKKQKTVFFVSVLFFILFISIATYFATRTNFTPLYSNLSPSETGTIKDTLDKKGIKSEIADGGKTIKVPDNVVDSLKVELAAQGIPKTGSIDYSFFSQNASFGMTENEFNVVKLDAMQTELRNLIKGIDGVNDAKVMINLPQKGIFVNDSGEKASASIVLDTKPGYEFKDDQITALYSLVSKSVPNLPTDNIVIMNQNFEYFDLNNKKNSQSGNSFAEQQDIKKQIERDVQRQVQTMLGTLMGQDKVVASVTADVDFTQENREENLVTPVDKDKMQGIQISAQKISETYTGKANQAGGTPTTQNPADSLASQYLEGSGNGTGDYEKKDEKINYDVNRIRRQIVESPYKIRDLGIQVMVEPPKANDPNSLPQERIDDIQKILGTIVRTTITKDPNGTKLTDQDVQNKIAVSVQPFKGKVQLQQQQTSVLPWWAYVIGGVLLLAIGVLVFLFLRSRKKQKDEGELVLDVAEPIEVPDVNEEQDTEASLRRKQLEKMAKDKPEDFAKLLRSWLAED